MYLLLRQFFSRSYCPNTNRGQLLIVFWLGSMCIKKCELITNGKTFRFSGSCCKEIQQSRTSSFVPYCAGLTKRAILESSVTCTRSILIGLKDNTMAGSKIPRSSLVIHLKGEHTQYIPSDSKSEFGSCPMVKENENPEYKVVGRIKKLNSHIW